MSKPLRNKAVYTEVSREKRELIRVTIEYEDEVKHFAENLITVVGRMLERWGFSKGEQSI